MLFDLLKTAPQYLLPKKRLTTVAGYWAEIRQPKIKNYLIQRFIDRFKVDMSEALIEDPSAYPCFNDFFVRRLKPECRPLQQAAIISPVDGCVSEIGSIENGQLVQAKGRHYSVEALLSCSSQKAAQFVGGKFVTLYLSPKDYHRVHLPMDAQLRSMTYVPGALFSVQPATARVVPRLFARNERLVIEFSTAVGPMMMVMVGATIVGAIGTSWHGDLQRTNQNNYFDYPLADFMKQGEEVGYFKLGSTVVLLFAQGEQMHWQSHLQTGSSIRFGEKLGELIQAH